MSGFIVEKFWHLNNYRYIFYRFLVEKYCKQSFSKKSSLMLDAGCGSRICSLSHVPKNVFVIGLDVRRKNILNSRRKANEKGYKNFSFIVASITSLPFRHDTFALTVCVDVLEHLLNKQKAVAEISRVCKLGAKLVGSTTNFLNPVCLFDSLAPKRVIEILTERFAPGHYERHSRFSPAKLMQTLKHSNFQALSVKLLGFPLFPTWLYQFSKKKIPWYAYLWIIFNKLTEKKPLNFLKETIVFHAIKKDYSKGW